MTLFYSLIDYIFSIMCSTYMEMRLDYLHTYQPHTKNSLGLTPKSLDFPIFRWISISKSLAIQYLLII